MAKIEDDVRGRLQDAALELFQERGYDHTTAVSIAERAGVTERTFFRHFPDKREVLFDGQATLREALTTAVGAAPHDLGPLDALFFAFHSLQSLLEDNRSFSEPRHHVIASTPALREREIAKTAALADDLASALKARGVDDLEAVLAAQAGMAAFVHAVISWIEQPTPGLGDRIAAAHRALRSLASA